MNLSERYLELSKEYQANIQMKRLSNLEEIDRLLNSNQTGDASKGFDELVKDSVANLCRVLHFDEEHCRLTIPKKYHGYFRKSLFNYVRTESHWKPFWDQDCLQWLFLSSYSDLPFEEVEAWQIEIMESISTDMCLIPKGEFQMGALNDDKDARQREKPQHRVRISNDYWVSKYPVTQYLVRKILGKAWWGYAEGLTRPTDTVTWFQAIEFCNAYSRFLGREEVYTVKETGDRNPECNWQANGVRLLTEAEWERAAKGGVSYHKFAGSNLPELVAWYSDTSGYSPQSIGNLYPNAYGLFDMCGNIAEWCWDWAAPYSSEMQTDPTGPTDGRTRVSRGGSAYLKVEDQRISNRWVNSEPDWSNNDLGFRIAWNAE